MRRAAIIAISLGGLWGCRPAPPPPAPAVEPPPPAALAGHWEGAIQGADGPAGLVLDLENNSVGWWGMLDVATWDPPPMALDEVNVQGDRLRMAVGDEPDRAVFDGRFRGGRIAGTFTRQGRSFPFWLTRGQVAVAARVPRPQTPAPPFPYAQKRVTFPAGDATLSGTLTLPDAPGAHAAVLLIGGTGSHTRDYPHHGHKMFWVLADALSRAGVAVLRVDDRGTGESAGRPDHATIPQRTADALASVRFLRAYPHIAADRIGLIGHSEGGWVAAEAAVRDPGVAFVILLATPGLSGAEVFSHQQHGAPLLQTPEARSFLDYDPAATLGKLRVSVLAVQGERDALLDAQQNLSAMRRLLAASHDQDVTVLDLPDVNHFMQPYGAQTDAGQIQETLSPEVLRILREWIARRFGPSSARPLQSPP